MARRFLVTSPSPLRVRYWSASQRAATKDACRIAGLEVIRLVNEPTAAALAYGLDRLGQELRIAVIDLGGGTLDVTIMEFGKGVFEVKATSGDTQLGGTDMNQRIFEHLAERFQMATGVDVRPDRKAVARLIEAAETAKIELTASLNTHLSLPYLAMAGGEPKHLELDLNRTELERLVHPVIERCRGPVEQALRDAGITQQEVDRIIFVGGPTRMPAVRSYFEKMFSRKPEMGVDPMECVAAEAAIQAGVLAGEVGGIVLVDVTPLTLGVETMGSIATPLIARNTPIPVKHSEIFTTAVDRQSSVTIHVFQGERPMASDNSSLGQFNLDGLPLADIPPEKRLVHTVFQSYALFPHMSVAQNMAFPLRMADKSADEIRRRLQETLELVPLSDKAQHFPAQHFPHELSGGQKQRVALARGLIKAMLR